MVDMDLFDRHIIAALKDGALREFQQLLSEIWVLPQHFEATLGLAGGAGPRSKAEKALGGAWEAPVHLQPV